MHMQQQSVHMSCLHPHLECATKDLHVHAPAMHHPNVREHSSMLRFTGKQRQASCAPKLHI